ncbi:MAG: gene transfer agent family protein [Sphingopyxis sp.]|uniref:gene transfer agent family protein n=1 Tax=Sphingopyxis sp. TaxID=1908224 RepID=UPI001A4F124D|nr:gene transfer agent family protein [Sphingopyxis sp.]MBL9069337.1 gene transfer agent family protein [Sphingopyxis sp.]
MSGAANALRGEAELCVGDAVHVLRPSFAALVAAEDELGPLFALVERAADGRLALGEMAALFWHCVQGRPAALTREAIGEALVKGGLAAATPALRVLLGQILQGRR